MFMSVCAFSFMDLIVKWSEHYPLGQVLFFRGFFGVIIYFFIMPKDIIKNSKVPTIVDAGIGTASDATIAMEMGCDGVLVNSAIAKAKNPILMAESFKNAVISGRHSFLAGRMKKLFYADASSPLKGLI